MTPIPPIPEDLRCFYASASERPNEYMGSAPFYNRKFAELIERIAKLIAERDEFKRKGEDLCSAYGNSLIKIHDLETENTCLKAPVTYMETRKFGFLVSTHGFLGQIYYLSADAITLLIASRATRTPPQEGQ